MGIIFKRYLDAPTHIASKIFGCHECLTHLSTSEDILSKAFQGQHGKAYLFNTVVNIIEGVAEDRHMTTGLHTVRDIYCVSCQSVVGWKYERAYEDSQKYKEGKYILERQLL
ncbi:Yippee/Mis18, partial [Gaertneriomyces semiglobifer]